MTGDSQRRNSATSQRSMERRDGSSSSNVNVFGDEFEVEGSPVADGFRPDLSNTTRQSTPRPSTPPRETKPANGEGKTDAAMRTGGQGSAYMAAQRNSFSLQGDNPDMPQRLPSMHQSSTSTAIPRTQSPYVGATAPSHPYGMYPQDTQLNRASTISSIRPQERPYNGPSQPAHPYGMYPQEAATEPESNPLAASQDIASVGFPGLGQNYARRLGPDGEEADDIIGPDGHTEQLPPYTRYPEGNPAKEITLMVPIAEAYAPGSPVSPQTPEHNPPNPTVSPVEGAAPTTQQSGPESSQLVEHHGSKEKWSEKSKQRTCFGRLPVWAVALIIIIVVIIAAVGGGLIGAFLGRPPKRHHPPYPESFNSSSLYQEVGPTTIYVSLTTTMIDAEPITSTPTNLPALATGTFALPMRQAVDRQVNCIDPSQKQQTNAWGCLMDGLLNFNVEYSDIDTPQVTLQSAPPMQARGLTYGAQAPNLTRPAGMELMTDVNDRQFGPAWYFCDYYDKLVILPENALTPPSQNKRFAPAESEAEPETETEASIEASLLQPRHPPQNNLLQQGDRPWYCWWNQTYLEGFIYLQEPSNATMDDVKEIISSYNSLQTPASGPSFTARSLPAINAAPAAKALFRRDDDGFDGEDEDDDEDDDDDDEHEGRGGGHGPGPLHMPQKGADYAGAIEGFAPPQLYPMAVKLEDRRVADSKVLPYCVQMQVLDDWRVNYATTDENGNEVPEPIKVGVSEMKPMERRALSRAASRRKSYRRNLANNDGGCLCEWMSD